ncbi:MAG TPA: amidohydrolase family protein [Thermoanaerobaculia bacterium]
MTRKTLLTLACGAALAGALGAETLAVRAQTIWTAAGPRLDDGVVLVRDGKIERVGPAAEVAIPAGATVIEGEVVTPGLVDAHTVVGLSGILNIDHDQDQLDTTAPIQPELRALDAYNPRERLVEWLRELGVTTIHTGHGPGALAAGQTMVAKTVGETVEQAVLRPEAMVAMTLGPEVGDNFESPGTRAKGVAMLRADLVKAQEYAKKRTTEDAEKRPARDLKLETLARVLAGELPALVTAHSAVDIVTALRLAREFGFPLVLDGASEAYLVLDEIRGTGVPVILHPTMARLSGETRSASLETAAKLADAGIPFAIQSGYEPYVPKTRVVLFEAAVAAANGLGFERALAAVTIDAARLLGVADRVGSLEPGKDADLVVYDGDPFEYTTHVCKVIVDGRLVSEECR